MNFSYFLYKHSQIKYCFQEIIVYNATNQLANNCKSWKYLVLFQ